MRHDQRTRWTAALTLLVAAGVPALVHAQARGTQRKAEPTPGASASAAPREADESTVTVSPFGWGVVDAPGRGALVRSVPAAFPPPLVQPGDVVLEVNGRGIGNAKELQSTIDSGGPFMLRVKRRGGTRLVALERGTAPAPAPSAGVGGGPREPGPSAPSASVAPAPPPRAPVAPSAAPAPNPPQPSPSEQPAPRSNMSHEWSPNR